MPTTVLLRDIVDALEMQFDEYSSYLDLDSGKVETISHEILREVEESDEDGEDDDEWNLARRIVDTDRFIELPSKFDVHEWQIMSDFADSLSSPKIQGEVRDAVHGTGAFRHFKSTVRRHNIEQSWFDFRSEALRQIALDWCEEHELSWK